MKAFNSEVSNIEAVTCQLLIALKVKVNSRTVLDILKSHPEYPSLLAISDCLRALKVKSESYQLDKNIQNISELPVPFITYFPLNGGKFALIKAIDSKQVKISNELSIDTGISQSQFKELWNGVILIAEVGEKSAEQGYYPHLITPTLQVVKPSITMIVVMSAIGMSFWLNNLNWQILAILLIKLLGIAVSSLLLLQSINSANPLIKRVCGFTGNNNNCNSILNSKYAKITNWLSWSEIGALYFTGSILCTLSFPLLLPEVLLMNIMALPFIAYSFIFQYKLRAWCILCSAIQATLIIEFIAFNYNGYLIKKINFPDLIESITIAICFSFPVIFWIWLKPILIKAESAKSLKYQLNRTKFNAEYFSWVLQKQKKLIIQDSLMPIRLGNLLSKNIITVVSDPFCFPCSKAHFFLDEWLGHDDNFQVLILFYIDNENSIHSRVVRQLMALSLEEDKKRVMMALREWYNSKDFEKWSKKFKTEIPPAVYKACSLQKKWRTEAGLNFTPTVLLNGYLLPDQYDVEDLKYLLN